MRVLGTSVLIFEAIVVGLFIPVAYFTGSASGSTGAWVGVVLAVLCVAAAALLKYRVGLALGWVVQVLLIASGVLVPLMYVLGVLFAALWVTAVVLARRADQAAAARDAARAQAPPTSGPADVP